MKPPVSPSSLLRRFTTPLKNGVYADSTAPSWLRAVRVPDDVASVSTRSHADEVDPRDVGMAGDSVENIWNAVEDYYRTGVHPAISMCLRKNGKIVLKRSIGHSSGNGPDDAPDAPKSVVTPDTPFCQFSASKAVTAMLIHHLDQQGRIHLMDPVSRYIPEFAQKSKSDITVYHVLAHQSGFPRIPPEVETGVIFDFDRMVHTLCEMKPLHKPGHNMSYHAITGGYILGEIIRRVTGRPITDYLQTVLRGPMGWKNVTFGAPEEVIPSVAVNEKTGYPLIFPFTAMTEYALGKPWDEVMMLTSDPRFYRCVIPAANLVATADEMSEFFQLLLNGGTWRGVEIFKPEVIRRATLESGKMKLDGSMLLIPMRYSPGMMLGADPFGLYGPNSSQAFGHWGFINSFCWADPSRDIAVSFLTSGKPFWGPHILRHFKVFNLIAQYCPQNISA